MGGGGGYLHGGAGGGWEGNRASVNLVLNNMSHRQIRGDEHLERRQREGQKGK
jgi:hypothetical protein